MIRTVRGHLLVAGLTLSLLTACAGNDTPRQAQVANAPWITPAAAHCGVVLGYVPPGLYFHSAEGSPAGDEVDLRYFDSASPSQGYSISAPWLLVHVRWGPAQSLSELSKGYAKTARTSVHNRPALVIYDGAPRTDLWWSDSSDVTADVDSTLGLDEDRRVAESLSIPTAEPSNLPGPSETGPSGCGAAG